jgi:hypothetical protein
MLQNTVEFCYNVRKGTEYVVLFWDIQRLMLAVVYRHFGTTYWSPFSFEDGTDRMSRNVANNYQHVLGNNSQERRPHEGTEFRNYNNESELRILCGDVKCTERKKFYKRWAFMKTAIHVGVRKQLRSSCACSAK